MKLYAIGHSHLTALEHAWTQGHLARPDLDCRFLQLWGRYEPFKVGDTFNPDLLAALKAEIDEFKPDVIVAPLVGSENFQLAFNSPDRPFDFISGDATEIEPESELVPLSLVRAKLREIDGYLGLLHELAGMSAVPVFYPLPPPPLNDPDAQRDMLEPRLKSAFNRLALPSPSLQMRLWQVFCDGIRAVCAAGPHAALVTAMPPPPAALDGDGFLLTERARDYVHADALYGVMALDQIISAMERSR